MSLGLASSEESPRNGRRMRLRRSDPNQPGIRRRRQLTEFVYSGPDGQRITEAAVLARIAALVIPPAWRQVWICTDPLGHLQATGVDSAGRKQYRYHARWLELERHRKFERMRRFAQALPYVREQLASNMAAGTQLNRSRVLSCSVRLLDVGLFRIGSEVYEREDGHLGLATLGKANVSVSDDALVFDYIGKEGVHQVHSVREPQCREIIVRLKRRRDGSEHLLAYRERGAWHQVHSSQINQHLKGLAGDEFTAKDFRTWNGTVAAAVGVVHHGSDADSARARKRAISATLTDVSELLGNTPAVARNSYVDPMVFDRFLCGDTIAADLSRIAKRRLSDEQLRLQTEAAVLKLLAP